MMLSWKIRYLNRADKQFKDRHLFLDTKMLDPVTRAAVEFVVDNESRKTEREILNYRHLFVENQSGTIPGNIQQWGNFITVGPSEYFEDETGKELTLQEMGPILTGSPFTVFIPNGAKQHHIDFMFSEPKSIPVAGITLDSAQLRLLGIFDRDLREMISSAFMKDGAGSLTFAETASLKTAATDDEIRSFVMTFRRLYMTSYRDPANFLKIVPVFVKAIGDHPYSKLVEAAAKEYENYLASEPEFAHFLQPRLTFSSKQLIDVFIYTQYAHQPSEEKQCQFGEIRQGASGQPSVSHVAIPCGDALFAAPENRQRSQERSSCVGSGYTAIIMAFLLMS